MALPGGDTIWPDDVLDQANQNKNLQADEDCAGQLEFEASEPRYVLCKAEVRCGW